jgi:hypothetical protein
MLKQITRADVLNKMSSTPGKVTLDDLEILVDPSLSVLHYPMGIFHSPFLDKNLDVNKVVNVCKKDPDFLMIVVSIHNFELNNDIIDEIINAKQRYTTGIYYKKELFQKILKNTNLNDSILEKIFDDLSNFGIRGDDDDEILLFLKSCKKLKHNQKLLFSVINARLKKCMEYLVFEKNIKFNTDCYCRYVEIYTYDKNKTCNMNNDYYVKLFDGLPVEQMCFLRQIINNNLNIVNYLIDIHKAGLRDIHDFDYFCKSDISRVLCDKLDKLEILFKNLKFTSEFVKKAIISNQTQIILFIFEKQKIKLDYQYLELLYDIFISDVKNSIFLVKLLKIGKNIDINKKFLDLAIECNNIYVVIYIIDSERVKISTDCLQSLFAFCIEKIKDINLEIIKKIFNNNKGIELDPHYLEIAIIQKNMTIIEYLVNDMNVKFDNQCTEKYFQYLHPTKKMYEKFFAIDNNDETNQYHLILAIEHHNVELIKYFLIEKNVKICEKIIVSYYDKYDFYKNDNELFEIITSDIIFTQLILNKACYNNDTNGILKILNQKDFIPNFNKCIENISQSKNINNDVLNEMLNIFCKFGYKITEEIIIKLIEKGFKLNDKLIKGFELTDKIYNLHRLTTEYVNGAGSNKKKKSNLMNSIEKIISNKNIIPDAKCFKFLQDYENKNCYNRYDHCRILKSIYIRNAFDKKIKEEEKVEEKKEEEKKKEKKIGKKQKKINEKN